MIENGVDGGNTFQHTSISTKINTFIKLVGTVSSIDHMRKGSV